MVFCFVQNFFFRTTQELENYFFLSRKVRNFFPELNIRLYTRTLNRIIFFSSTKIRIFLSATLGIRIFFQNTQLYIYIQCHLNTWPRWAVFQGPHEHKGPMLFYVCCVQHVFLMLNTDFVGSTNTINICLILSTFTVLFL